jgi:hypothetical protein
LTFGEDRVLAAPAFASSTSFLGFAFVLSWSSVDASASRACSISRWMVSGSRATGSSLEDF